MGSGSNPKAPKFKSTSSSNPYATSYVNKNGQSGYQLNNFLTGMNAMVENVVPSLYNQLLNPSLDNPVSQARMNAFSNALENESYKQFENNLSALSKRGMLRSSAADDMTNKLTEYQNDKISEFANNLIANNTSDVTSMLNTFLNQYLMGANLGQSSFGNALSSNQLLNNYNLSSFNAGSNNNNLRTLMALASVMSGMSG